MALKIVVPLYDNNKAFLMIDFFSIWTQLASRKATGNTSAPALRLWVVKLCLIESECYKNLNTGNIIQTNLQFSDILLPPP